MRSSRLTVFALAALFAAAGCDDETAGPAAANDHVEGSVARLKTGEGVPNLVVALRRGGDLVAASVTDVEGAFRFPAVPHGTYEVRLTGLELAGLSPATTAFDPPVRQVTVSASTEPVLFAAVGLFTQVRAVVSCGGAPAAGTAVRVVGGAVDELLTTNTLGEGVVLVEPGSYAVVPVDPPCALDPGFRIAEVLQGQSVTVPFQGAGG